MATPIQINEELLAGEGYFADAPRRAELRSLFRFDERRVLLGNGAVARLAEECAHLGARRVVLVRDAALESVAAPVVAALAAGGIEVVMSYTDIVANPTVAGVDDLAARLNHTDGDAVVAVGGGSTMDTAKVAVAVGTCGGSVADYAGFDRFDRDVRWPVLAVPTTAGTGAEASRVSVVVGPEGKFAVYDDHVQPRCALVDPALTAGMPPELTATTGLDAIGHALECTASTKSHPLADAVARASLAAGLPWLERAIAAGDDAEARMQMCRCSLLAGLLLSPINTGAGHALGYSIEKLSHERGRAVPHGTAVALVLPGVMRHNAPAAADKYYYAAGAAGVALRGSSREAGVEAAANWIDRVRRQHTPFASLADAALTADDVPRMVEIAMGVRRLLDPNPVQVTAADAERIYREVLA